jgi:anti-sigma-K factor RskA
VSQHRDEHLDLCAEQALGTIDAEGARVLEEHLAAGCAECERALADFAFGVSQIGRAVPSIAPAASLRDRVLIAASSTRAAAPSEGAGEVVALPRRRAAWFGWTAAAAAAACAVLAGVLWNRVGDLERRLAEERGLTAVLGAPQAKVAELEVTPDGVRLLKARATYDPQTRSAVVVFSNFTPPAGRDYELWAIRDGKPASLGVVPVDAGGRAVMRIADAGDPAGLAAFAVSLEPRGGSPDRTAPSGPVVMLGKLGG